MPKDFYTLFRHFACSHTLSSNTIVIEKVTNGGTEFFRNMTCLLKSFIHFEEFSEEAATNIPPFSLDSFTDTHYVFLTVPHAPPSNVRVTGRTSTSVIVSWGYVPVDHQNGIIRNYRINISLGTSMSQQFDSIDVGAGSSKVISSLLKWTYYTVQVAASTIMGIGPYSSPRTGRTLEDSEFLSFDKVWFSANM